jgi:hypothetical protein
MSMSMYYIISSTDIYNSVIGVVLELVISTRNHHHNLEIEGNIMELVRSKFNCKIEAIYAATTRNRNFRGRMFLVLEAIYKNYEVWRKLCQVTPCPTHHIKKSPEGQLCWVQI